MSDLELLRLRAKAKLKLRNEQPEPKKNFAPSVEEMEAAKAEVEPTTMEGISAGVVEGIPFMKDAVAAYDSMADAMEEDDVSFDRVYNGYKERLDQDNKDLNNAERQAPYAFGGGEILGTAATLFGAGAAAGATQAGAAMSASQLSMATGVGVGAAQGLSMSEDRTVTDAVVGGAMGAAGELGGRLVGKALKKSGKYLLDTAGEQGSIAVKKLLGIRNASSNRQLYKHLKKTGQKESQFISDVLTQKLDDGTTVIDFGDAPELMLSKIDEAKGVIGRNLDGMYKQIDKEYGVKVDLTSLKESLKDDVLTPFNTSDDPGMQQIGMDLADYIEQIGRNVKSAKTEMTPKGPVSTSEFGFDTEWNLTRVNRLRKDISKRIESIYKKNGLDMSASKEQQRKVAASLRRRMDEVLEAADDIDPGVLGQVKQANKSYGNMATIGDTVEKEMTRSSDDSMSMLKEAIGLRSLMISGAATSALGPAGMVVGPIATKVINSPRTPLYLAEGVKKIGTIMSAAPTGEIASRLTTAAMMNNDKFRDTMYGTVGEINLKNQPLARSVEDIKARSTDIHNFLKYHKPEMATAFTEAMESGDDSAIASLIDQATKLPGSNKIIQPGVGIDGFVYTLEDKQMLEIQLKQTDMPASVRMEMILNLRANGKIPDMERVVRPQPKQHVPRAKKIQDY